MKVRRVMMKKLMILFVLALFGNQKATCWINTPPWTGSAPISKEQQEKAKIWFYNEFGNKSVCISSVGAGKFIQVEDPYGNWEPEYNTWVNSQERFGTLRLTTMTFAQIKQLQTTLSKRAIFKVHPSPADWGRYEIGFVSESRKGNTNASGNYYYPGGQTLMVNYNLLDTLPEGEKYKALMVKLSGLAAGYYYQSTWLPEVIEIQQNFVRIRIILQKSNYPNPSTNFYLYRNPFNRLLVKELTDNLNKANFQFDIYPIN